MASLNIEISEKLNHDLILSAKEEDLSKESIVCKAIELYLEELMEDREDYKQALEALKDDSPNLSWEEVMRNCGLED